MWGAGSNPAVPILHNGELPQYFLKRPVEMQGVLLCKKGKNMKYLNEYTTKELVEELKKREGVSVTVAEPYESKEIDVEGPAIVITVID